MGQLCCQLFLLLLKEIKIICMSLMRKVIICKYVVAWGQIIITGIIIEEKDKSLWNVDAIFMDSIRK